MKKRTLGTKLLLALVTLGVLAYFAVQAVRYFGDPLTTTLAYRYEVELSDDLSGYVIRDERVLTDTAGGEKQLQRTEGERVSAGGLVALAYADEAARASQEQLQTVETQIEQLEYAQAAALGAEISLRLDTQISQSILDYRRSVEEDRLDRAEDYGAELRSLVLKRDYTHSSAEDLSAQLAELESQAAALRTQTGASTQRITAPEAGLYSAVVDGYETVLTPEALEELTPGRLARLEPDEDVLSAPNVGKLVLGDAWYYAAAVDEETARTLQETKGLKLRFAKGVSRDLDVELLSVSEPEGGRVTVVFRGDTYLPELTLLRQQSAEVIRRTMEGIRVPIEAVRLREQTVTDDDGGETLVRETGVYCIVGMEARFKPVEVLYSDENFALVRSTLDTADTTTGLEEIRLRAGDEVIITARDLYDGKTMS